MPSDVRLLFDEDTHLAVAGALRSRGYDALHVREVGRLGLKDADQLGFAASKGRCFFTFNLGEFVVLHGEYMTSDREHSEIAVSAQKPVGRLLRDCLAFVASHSAHEVRNQLFVL